MTSAKTTEKPQTIEQLTYIDFDYNGTTYTMEFNRKAVEVLEKAYGVNVARLMRGEVELTTLPDIFRCSLLMHHPRMKQQTADNLFSLMDNKDELLAALIELAAVAVNSVFEEPEEGKAISWTRH